MCRLMPGVTFDFSDATVIVTGATSGIGRAVALAFGEAGATVINADIETEPKDAVRPTHTEIRERGGDAVYVETDVTSVSSLESAVATASDFGGVDVMVNNAGIFIEEPLMETSVEHFERIHAVNAKGVFFGIQAAANDMVARGTSGSIINTASISSVMSQPGHAQYESTKGAVRMITQNAALELSEHGIRVNAVAPGHIATEIVEGWADEAMGAVENNELIKPVPLGRAGTPQDVAGTYLYLASEAATYVTGELAFVDGGLQIV